MMKLLNGLVRKSQSSTFYLWLLNLLASRAVPFNKPHSFKIRSIRDHEIEIELPYKKRNLNHIKGIHACALATLCEYSTGMLLLTNLDATRYRIILKNINITYHYQARKNVYAHFALDKEWVQKNIIEALRDQEAIFHEFSIDVKDEENNSVCTGLIQWQVKDWNKVRTR